MDTDVDMRPVAYAIIGLGCLMSFATAVVPHFSAGHKLLVSVLILGITPYVVYGALTEILTGWSLVAPGVLILAVDAATRLPERWFAVEDFPSTAVYLAPIWLIFLILPIGVFMGRWLEKK